MDVGANADIADVAATEVADANVSDVNPMCILDDTYTFGAVGGLTAYDDESTLAPPGTYHRVRTYHRADAGTKECSAPVPACQVMDSIGLIEIVAALKDADVQAAFSEPTPLVYGYDARPVDGSVYSIKRSDGHGMLVGGPCTAGAVGCRAIPSGVAALSMVFQLFDSQMLHRGDCGNL